MPVAEFERLVRLGLGRPLAYLASGHDPAPYRDVIRTQALQNWTFEASEVERGQYVLNLLELAGLLEEMRPRIIGAIASTDLSLPAPAWPVELDQLIDIAALLAGRGDREARRVLLDALARAVTSSRFPDLLLRNGDLAMVTEIASVIGGSSVPRDEEYHDHVEYVLSYARDRFGVRRVGNALTAASARDQRVAEFFHAAKAERRRRLRRPRRARPEPAGYDQMRPLLSVEPYYRVRGRLLTWGLRADEADVLMAAGDLLDATDVLGPALLNGLAVFARRPFPLDPSLLVELVRRADVPADSINSSMSALIVSTTVEVLELVPSVQVRALAMELAERSAWRAEAVPLLVSTYDGTEGDANRIAELSRAEPDPENQHGIMLDILRLADRAEPAPIEVDHLLQLAYELTPCGYCRESVVRRLIDRAALPVWIALECRWDANPETRSLVVAGAPSA